MFKQPFFPIANIEALPLGEVNVGGILDRIRLIPAAQVRRVATPLSDGILPTDFMYADLDTSFVDVHLSVDSGLFLETMQTTVNGNAWLQELSFDLAKTSGFLSNWIAQNIEIEFFAFITDKNRKSFLLGDLCQPLKFTEDVGSPSGRAGQNKRQWKLSALVCHPAYGLFREYQLIEFVEIGGELLVKFPLASFDAGFNNGFDN
jgi:hypothetical protein